MLLIAISSYVVLSLIASIIVLRSDHLEHNQSIYQLFAIWLVPYFGALAILVFHSVVHTNMTTEPETYRTTKNSNDGMADDLFSDAD